MAEAKRLSPEELERHISELEKSLENARKERDALSAFKAYTHQRLDDAGVPTHPEGPHSKAGCRIGDRLDIALARLKPSGQVAEDMVCLRATIREWTTYSAGSREDDLAALFRLAAKAQGYEAAERLSEARALAVSQMTSAYEAAVADNAALAADGVRLRRSLEPLRERAMAASGTRELWQEEYQILRACNEHDAMAGQPHPSAALLEQLTQAAALLHQRPVETLPDAIRRAYADHDKALVRARNEGLERAATRVDWLAVTSEGRGRHEDAEFRRALADDIRTMKDPEQ